MTGYNVNVEIDGVVRTRAEWCVEYGIPQSTVRNRVSRSGWSLVEAITTPVS